MFLEHFVNLGAHLYLVYIYRLWQRLCSVFIEQFTNFGAHLHRAQAMTDPLMNLGVGISYDSGFVV